VSGHLADCARSGDCEEACRFVVNHVGVEFRIVALNAAGEYENRLATADEKAATCRAIYFDSDTDFSDESTADTYLVWEAANTTETEPVAPEGWSLIEGCDACGADGCSFRLLDGGQVERACDPAVGARNAGPHE
jgi:hypothetical protein